MRKNNEFINKSKILQAIVNNIETLYPDDISLFICYGSYVTGEYNELSDIDFCFIPRNDKAYRLCKQFIINDIGYDLWPISWDRMESIANLDDNLVSILMDGIILFTYSENEIEKINILKQKLINNLSDELHSKKQSMNYIMKAKIDYYNCMDNILNDVSIINILEHLLFALAIINGKYTKKGVKSFSIEVKNFLRIPNDIIDDYTTIITNQNKHEIFKLVKKLIDEIEILWNSKYCQTNQSINPDNLNGFYEEFKSTYNKLIRSCNESDYNAAYYAAYMIDRETQSMLIKYANKNKFPSITTCLKNNGFIKAKEECLKHETFLLEILDENKIEICKFNSVDDYMNNMAKTSTP